MPALITGAPPMHPAARPRLVIDGPAGKAARTMNGVARYGGLRRQDLVTAVTEAELRGRGGAASSSGASWPR